MPQIIQLNEFLEPIIGNSKGTGITQSQFRQYLAVVDSGNPPLVAGNIPVSPYNSINIGWNSSVVVFGGALWKFAMSQLGFSNTQSVAQFKLAASYPYYV